MQDREVIINLVQALEKVLDYAVSMRCATGYYPDGSPNLLVIGQLVNTINRDYKIKEFKMGVDIYGEGKEK